MKPIFLFLPFLIRLFFQSSALGISYESWICCSGNFAGSWNDLKIKSDQPGSAYGLVMKEVKLLGKNYISARKVI